MTYNSSIYVGLLWPVQQTKYRDEYDLGTINRKGSIKNAIR